MAGADLAGKDEVAEAGLRGSGEDVEDHQGAMEGNQSEIVFGEDGAVEGQSDVRPGEVETHQKRENGADGDGDQGKNEVLTADGAVVGGEDSKGRGEK